MRICVYGNLANNAYIITKFLRKMGFHADVGIDPDDTFPISQPIWEDLDFELSVSEYYNQTYEFWLNFASKKKYVLPNWVKNIGIPTSNTIDLIKNNLLAAIRHPICSIRALFHSNFNFYNFVYIFLNLTRITSLANYDFVIGFGLGPSFAYLAGIKYASIPYGADLLEIPFQNNHHKWVYRARARYQKIGYQNSEIMFIGNDPTYSEALNQIKALQNRHYWAFPYDIKKYQLSQKDPINNFLPPSIVKKIDNKIIFFVPSRIDFEVKGSDKVLRAFAKLLKENDNTFLILVSWGNDVDKAKKLVLELDLNDHVYFHPNILSKPRLIRFINTCDVILDQFSNSGAYGTISMEVMSCGKPLITHIDYQKLKKFHTGAPPIENAFTELEIFHAMLSLCDKQYRETLGQNARDWIIENHSDKSFSNFVKYIKIVLKKI